MVINVAEILRYIICHSILCIVVTAVCCNSLLAQDEIVNYKRLTIADGLNFRKVNSINQDDTGLIWVGTDLGLQFYDGHDFIDFVYDGVGDPFTTVNDIEKSATGEMYLSTSEGVLKYNAEMGAFYHLSFAEKGSKLEISKVIIGPDDSLFAVGDDRVYVYREDSFQEMQSFPEKKNLGSRNQFIYNEFVDSNYLMIMFGQYDVLYNIENDSIVNFKSRGDKEGRFCMMIDNRLRIVSRSGREIDKTTFAYQGCIFENIHTRLWNSIVVGNKNMFIDNRNDELLFYNGNEFAFKHKIENIDGLRIYDQFQDTNGDYFIATNFGIIVLRLKESIFEIIDKTDGSQGKFETAIRKIVETSQGYLMYSRGSSLTLNSNDSVLFIKNMGQEFMDLEPVGHDSYFALSLFASKFLKVEDEKVDKIKLLNIGGHVCQKLNTTYLVGGQGLVEYDLDSDKVIRHIGSKSDQVRSILLKPDGKFYVGSQIGLTEYNSSFDVVRNLANQSISQFDQANINDIYIDQDSLIWLATQGNGVVVLDADFNVIKRISKLNGLPNDVVYSINYDGEDFWFPTDYGLARYNDHSGLMSNYFEEDGISNNEFNRYSNCITKEGDILLGTLNGIVKCKKNNPGKQGSELKLFISDVQSNYDDNLKLSSIQQTIKKKEKIVIRENKGYAKLNFGITDFMSPEDHKYAYRWSKEQDWILLGNKNTIELLDLAGGNYELEIKGKSKSGQEARIHSPISILSIPPIYKRLWFFVLVSLLVLLLLYMFYRWRLSQIQRVQSIRQSISKDLHDEVGSMLTEITILTDVARSVDSRSDQSKFLDQISHKGRDAISAMSDVIWTIDTGSSTLGDLVTKMNNVMGNLLTPIDVSFNITKKNLDVNKNLSITLKKNIYLIFKEAIHNIVKHSSANDVQIQITQVGHGLKLSVINNKTHILKDKTSYLSNGLGLKSMHDRAEIIGGSLKITDIDDAFIVFLEIPHL